MIAAALAVALLAEPCDPMSMPVPLGAICVTEPGFGRAATAEVTITMQLHSSNSMTMNVVPLGGALYAVHATTLLTGEEDSERPGFSPRSAVAYLVAGNDFRLLAFNGRFEAEVGPGTFAYRLPEDPTMVAEVAR